jgi:hypothetical protein
MSINPNFSSYDNPLNNPDITYPQLLDYLENKIADMFAREVGDSIENTDSCQQSVQAISKQSLSIAPGVKVTNCNIKLSSKTYVSTDETCSNPDKKIFEMSEERRNQVFSKICGDILLELKSAFPEKPTFISYFIPMLKQSLMTMNYSKFNCTQDVIGIRDQKVKITKDLTCDSNSPITIDGKIWANIRMKCLAKTSLDTLRNNTGLQRFFSYKESDDCNYDKVIIKECDGSKRTVKIRINRPARGTGSCPYTDEQELEEPCSYIGCEIGDWKAWSPCFEVNGIGKQYRTREILKPGEYCPSASNLKEERKCVVGQNTGVQSELNDELANIKSDGNNKKESSNLIFLILIVIFLIICFVLYSKFIKK